VKNRHLKMRINEEMFILIEKLARWNNLSKTNLIENLVIKENRELLKKGYDINKNEE
jgi:hypothetical protein